MTCFLFYGTCYKNVILVEYSGVDGGDCSQAQWLQLPLVPSAVLRTEAALSLHSRNLFRTHCGPRGGWFRDTNLLHFMRSSLRRTHRRNPSQNSHFSPSSNLFSSYVNENVTVCDSSGSQTLLHRAFLEGPRPLSYHSTITVARVGARHQPFSETPGGPQSFPKSGNHWHTSLAFTMWKLKAKFASHL